MGPQVHHTGYKYQPPFTFTTTSLAEMWREVLFWAFAMTTVLYLGVGLVCAVCLRPPKRLVGVVVPLLYLFFAEVKVLCTDAVASEAAPKWARGYVCTWSMHYP